MKRILKYILPVLVVVIAACSKESATLDDAQNTGTLKMSISATRTEAGEYNPLDHLVVRIFNSEGGLLRKYSSQQDIPATLQLIAGTYSVAVEAGNEQTASFESRFYKGEKTFSVTAGKTTAVEVKCKIQNTVVEVKFDQTVAKNFGTDFSTRIAVSATYDEENILAGKIPSLKYTADAKGYFTLPEGLTSMAWCFTGEHATRGTVVKTGKIEDLKAGSKYQLTFKFSDDLPGFVEALLIKVDTSSDDQDDTIIFSPDPSIEGAGFDMKQIQKYTTGDKTFNISTMSAMKRVAMTLDGVEYEIFGSAPTSTEGIVTVASDDRNLAVTLSDALFAGRTGGDHTLSFHITDTNKGELTATSTFRLQGLLPVDATSYDMWTRSLKLQAVSFAPASEVAFSLRKAAGEWAALSVDKDATKDLYTATFAPEWVDSLRTDNTKIYYLKKGTGLTVATEYEYTVAAGDVTAQGSFTTPAGQAIPDGNMEDAALPCFDPKGSSSSSVFWGSGNNSNTKTLCSQATDATGNHYANMQTVYYLVAPAAGNLFTGIFNFSMASMTGTVGFGQQYAYTARPKALHVNYHAKVGKVDYNKANGPLAVGEQDKARIFVAIVDWTKRHNVASTLSLSGTSTCLGSWDPEKGPDAVPEGKILGYASMAIDATTESDALVSSGDALTIYWYDKDAAVPAGNYTLVISCTANAYGDFFNCCSTNHLWVDDFEWVY